MKKYFTSCLLILFLAGSGVAQKIKYKDVFPLLHPNRTEEGITLLKQYLSVEKNIDEGNAQYQLAQYYKDLYESVNILADTASLFSYADSAISTFELAKSHIDEKELKRNDEYYQSFYRRDLRTGEFGIKLSDVHLDIESSIKAMQEKNQIVLELHQLLASMSQTSQSMTTAFNSFVASFTTREKLVFQLGSVERSQLKTLQDFQYQMTEKDKQIVGLLDEIKAEGLIEPIELLEVPDFESIESQFDPYKGQYAIWDVDQWVTGVLDQFEQDIEAYQAGLKKWDTTLDFVAGRIKEGSMSNIEVEPNETVKGLAEKYDEEQSMVDFLRAKARMLLVEMMTDTLINPDLKDSSLVQLHFLASDRSVKILQTVEPLLDGLSQRVEQQEVYFADHIDNLYKGLNGILDQIGKWEKTLPDRLSSWENQKDYWWDRNNWTVWKSDSIALNVALDSINLRYVTVHLDPQKDGSLYAYGLDKDTLATFVARVEPDRSTSWVFKNELAELVDMSIDSLVAMPLLSSDSTIVYYQFVQADTLTDLKVFKLKLSGEVIWSSDVPDGLLPDHTSWDEVINQYTLFYYPEDAYPLSDGTAGYIIVDQNGEIK